MKEGPRFRVALAPLYSTALLCTLYRCTLRIVALTVAQRSISLCPGALDPRPGGQRITEAFGGPRDPETAGDGATQE
eukprot:2682714-Pyramimonas_sp.AAC.1